MLLQRTEPLWIAAFGFAGWGVYLLLVQPASLEESTAWSAILDVLTALTGSTGPAIRTAGAALMLTAALLVAARAGVPGAAAVAVVLGIGLCGLFAGGFGWAATQAGLVGLGSAIDWAARIGTCAAMTIPPRRPSARASREARPAQQPQPVEA